MTLSYFESAPLIESEPILRTEGEILHFNLGEHQREDTTTYNPSTPFMDNDRQIMMVRVESASLENDSRVMFVDLETSEIIPDAPIFEDMQDPYYLGHFVDEQGEDYQVIGGVQISLPEEGSDDDTIRYQEVFYRYKNSITEPGDLELFSQGNPQQKGTRFVQTPDGIAVFPRPQGDFGGKGRVGFFMTDNLDTLEEDLHRYLAIADEESLIPGLFHKLEEYLPGEEWEWGGFNQVFPPNADGTIPFIGHRAYHKVVDGVYYGRVYEAIAGTFDPSINQVSDFEVIASGKDFPMDDVKYPESMAKGDLIYTSGYGEIDQEAKTGKFYAGIGDLATGVLDGPLPKALLRSSELELAA